MAENPSATTARKSHNQSAIQQIADHIIEEYKPQNGPIVLMWRDVMNGWHRKKSEDFPVWTRDDSAVHRHWKRFGRGVEALLKLHKFAIVRVNGNIRNVTKHGTEPKRTGKRTDERYLECIPSSNNPTFGIVLFPRDTHKDHPLILASRGSRCKSDAARTANGVDSVRAANDLGNLSDDKRDDILGSTRTTIDSKFDEVLYPLLEKLESPPPAELTPPSNSDKEPMALNDVTLGLTPAEAIARLADGERLRMLVEYGSKPLSKDRSKRGSLVEISRPRQDVIDMLNRPGADIRASDDFAISAEYGLMVAEAKAPHNWHFIATKT